MELARNLKVESVSRLHATAALCLGPRQTVGDAVRLMRQHRVGCVLVHDRGEVVGLFTERDLLRRVLAIGRPLSTPLAECMTADPVTVKLASAVDEAVRLMEEGGYRHLPVIDEFGRAVGVLSVKRIVHYLVEHFPSTVYCLPPDPNVYPRHREGA